MKIIDFLENSTIKNKKEDMMKDRIQIDGVCYIREDKLLVTPEKLKEVESNFQAIKNHLGRLNDRLIIAETSSEECVGLATYVNKLRAGQDSLLATIKTLEFLITSKEEEISGLKADVVYHRGRESALSYECINLKNQITAYQKEKSRLLGTIRPEHYTSSLETEIVAVEPVYTKDSSCLKLTIALPQIKFNPSDKIKIYKLGR